MLDLPIAPGLRDAPRHSWGLNKMAKLPAVGNPQIVNNNAFRQQKVKEKIEHWMATAVAPQQLTIPRQNATTKEGASVYRIFEGRDIRKMYQVDYPVREKGVRVVVLENAEQSRFVMSPLFNNRHDALSWAVNQMRAEV